MKRLHSAAEDISRVGAIAGGALLLVVQVLITPAFARTQAAMAFAKAMQGLMG